MLCHRNPDLLSVGKSVLRKLIRGYEVDRESLYSSWGRSAKELGLAPANKEKYSEPCKIFDYKTVQQAAYAAHVEGPRHSERWS